MTTPKTVCGKCNGRGQYLHFGVCFACQGKGEVKAVPRVLHARRSRAECIRIIKMNLDAMCLRGESPYMRMMTIVAFCVEANDPIVTARARAATLATRKIWGHEWDDELENATISARGKFADA